MGSISELGNGVGFLYITKADGTTVLSSELNNFKGRYNILRDGLIHAPTGGEILAVGTVNITAGGGSITNVTVNAVGIMGAVAATGATASLTGIDLANKINSAISAPDYSAVSIDDGVSTTVYIFAAAGSGTTPNGYVVTATFVGPTAGSDTDMAGGSAGSGAYAPSVGHRYFINASTGATQGTLAGSTEITSYVINRGLNNSIPGASVSILSGIVNPSRLGSISVLTVDTEGAAASDDLDIINTAGFANNDYIIIRGANAARLVTVKNGTFPGTDNIVLTNNTDFITNGSASAICLQYLTTTSAGVPAWVEIWRTAVFPSVTNLRAQNVATPAQGTTSTTIGVGPTTITLIPGTDKEYQRLTGAPVLAGNIVVTAGGTPKDGDHFIIDYRTTATVGGFSVTIFGIALTTTQALEGNVIVYAYYDSTGAAWRAFIFKTVVSEDLVDTTQLATKENSLGNPAASGYVLSSTSGGTRSWIPNANNQTIYNTTANNQTTAIITEEVLKTYTVAANELANNGDMLIVRGVYQTAANANAKTVSVFFGATAIGTITGNYNADTIVVEGEINRITNATQSAWCRISVYDTAAPGTAVATAVMYTTPAETLSATVALQFRATNGVAAAGDIISRQGAVLVAKMRT